MESLLADLFELRRGICSLRKPLPLLLRELAAHSLAAGGFWEDVAASLLQKSVSDAWTDAIKRLEPDLQSRLAPIGGFLTGGEDELGKLIDETREELAGYLHAQRLRQAAQRRIETALCLAGAGLAVLVMM